MHVDGFFVLIKFRVHYFPFFKDVKYFNYQLRWRCRDHSLNGCACETLTARFWRDQFTQVSAVLIDCFLVCEVFHYLIHSSCGPNHKRDKKGGNIQRGYCFNSTWHFPDSSCVDTLVKYQYLRCDRYILYGVYKFVTVVDSNW